MTRPDLSLAIFGAERTFRWCQNHWWWSPDGMPWLIVEVLPTTLPPTRACAYIVALTLNHKRVFESDAWVSVDAAADDLRARVQPLVDLLTGSHRR